MAQLTIFGIPIDRSGVLPGIDCPVGYDCPRMSTLITGAHCILTLTSFNLQKAPTQPQLGQSICSLPGPVKSLCELHSGHICPTVISIRNHPTNIPCISQGRRSNEDLPWNRTQHTPSVEGQKQSTQPQYLYASLRSYCRTSEFSGLGFIFSFCCFYEPLYDAVIGLFSH